MTPRDKVTASITTARAHLEQALADLDRLPAIDHSTLAFTAHALNNYMTVTGGTVELLQQALSDHSDPQVQVWLDALHHVTNLMAHAVGQLMHASAPGGPPLVFDQVDLVALLRRACWYYQRRADRKGIQVSLEITTEPPDVWTDRVAVAAILDNLLSNAVKFSESGTRVTVQIRSEPAYLVCSVRDEGPGISLEDRAKLFRPATQLGAVPTAGESSAGYGLAVAKQLVDKLHGEIWCESESGRGACFSFRLPVSAWDVSAATEPPKASEPVPP